MTVICQNRGTRALKSTEDAAHLSYYDDVRSYISACGLCETIHLTVKGI
jgi:hypothetical protein